MGTDWIAERRRRWKRRGRQGADPTDYRKLLLEEPRVLTALEAGQELARWLQQWADLADPPACFSLAALNWWNTITGSEWDQTMKYRDGTSDDDLNYYPLSDGCKACDKLEQKAQPGDEIALCPKHQKIIDQDLAEFARAHPNGLHTDSCGCILDFEIVLPDEMKYNRLP